MISATWDQVLGLIGAGVICYAPLICTAVLIVIGVAFWRRFAIIPRGKGEKWTA